MKITQLFLTNYRRFADLKIPFESANNTTVFIGNNGAGKTAILDALSLNLSQLIWRITQKRGYLYRISDNDILNGKSTTVVKLGLVYEEEPYSWTATKTRKGHKASVSIESLATVSIIKLADIFKERLTQDSSTSMPLIAYYPVERAVVDIPLKIKARHNFEQLDGYDNSLKKSADFRRFFEWFRYREDIENEWFRDNPAVDRASHSPDDQLKAVRNAIELFIPEFDNLRVERRPRLRMVVNKIGTKLDVSQLSQGEKSLMSLVGDIARRLAMMNPALENPLEGEGVVLIDEIDMHLHPTWQRSVIGNLNKTFPNCQFILTTHSPIVISETPKLLVYALDDGEITKLNNLYGMDVNYVLLREMDAQIRNVEIQNAFDNLLDAIQEGNIDVAKSHCAELQKKVAVDNLELNKMQLLIKRLEVQHAKNN